MKFSVGQRITPGYALALLILIALEGASYQSLSSLVESGYWVEQTYKVLKIISQPAINGPPSDRKDQPPSPTLMPGIVDADDRGQDA